MLCSDSSFAVPILSGRRTELLRRVAISPHQLPGRERLALSTGSSIRLEINWCGAKKFLAFMAEIRHNSGRIADIF